MANTKQSYFRGFALADANIERTHVNCRSCVNNSCGLRDCKLQVFELNKKEKVLLGGLCPKGNTHPPEKRAPNYVKLYRKMLGKHLEPFSYALEDLAQQKTPRVLIPQSLNFLNEKGIFYTALYDALGFAVAISPESNEEIAALGKRFAHSESCYPVILAHGHAALLENYTRRGLDHILLPNLGGEYINGEHLRYCPYVASAGHIIRGNLSLNTKEVFMPALFFNDPTHPLNAALQSDFQSAFGYSPFSLKQLQEAVHFAQEKQQEFIQEAHLKGESIAHKLSEKNESIYIGIGRGYTIFDQKASSKVEELFASQGLHFIPAQFLDIKDYPLENIADNMYWLNGRKILRSTIDAVLHSHRYPVRLANFNCGSDSILLAHEEDIVKKAEKPGLELETDGHNSNAQFRTRIAAYNEVVRNARAQICTIENLATPLPSKQDLEQRRIGVSYMGNASYVIAASMRAVGLRAEVMPYHTKTTLELGKKLVQTNTCKPFSFQVGEHLAWLYALQKQGINPNTEAAAILPKSNGPCRFGQYSSVLRKYYNNHGFQGVPFIDPSDTEDYQNLGFSDKKTKEFYPIFLRGLLSADLLMNSLLRTRPYEKDKGSADALYTKAFQNVLETIENRGALKEFKNLLKAYAPQFQQLCKKEARYPLILMNGEIYMRCNEHANQESIRLLENHGLEVLVEPVSGWINYINRGAIRQAWQNKNYSQLPYLLMKRAYINYISNVLSKPFIKYLQGREQHNPFPTIDALEKNHIFSYTTNEGESTVSIANAYAFMNNQLAVDGIYHLGPFGCMQETAATSRIQALIQEKKRSAINPEDSLIPFMDAVFGESELSNLDAEIALFAENCRLRKKLSH